MAFDKAMEVVLKYTHQAPVSLDHAMKVTVDLASVSKVDLAMNTVINIRNAVYESNRLGALQGLVSGKIFKMTLKGMRTMAG